MEGGLRIKHFKRSVSQPVLSIITTVFNGGAFIEKTIQSVMAQQKNNIEYIVIDGGSNDNTIDILKKYDHYIDYWISEKDNGIYDAMNKGWEKASSDSHILFLGAGDKLVSLPENLKLDHQTIYFGDVDLGGKIIFNAKVDFRLKVGNTLHHQALLIPKSLSQKPPFNTTFKVYADFDFNQRLYKQNAKFHKIENFLSYASPDGFSQQYRTYEWIKIVRKNFGGFYASIAVLYHLFQKIKTKNYAS